MIRDVTVCTVCDNTFESGMSIEICPNCGVGHIDLSDMDECCEGCVACYEGTYKHPCFVSNVADLCNVCQSCQRHCECKKDEEEEPGE